MTLDKFLTKNLFTAGTDLFAQLGIRLNSNTSSPIRLDAIIENIPKGQPIFDQVSETYFLGLVDDSLFAEDTPQLSYEDTRIKLNKEYEGIMIFALALEGEKPNRTQLTQLTRAFNRASQELPVILLVKYGEELAFLTCERTSYKQTWRPGDKLGKVTMLKDVHIENTHRAHLRIIEDLKIPSSITGYTRLYQFWYRRFSIQALNDQFYAELQDWFYYATTQIKLPIKPAYTSEKENTKNFLVRLLARSMFCWFVKEKGLIRKELLELYDSNQSKYPLTADIDKNDFLESNSYYRGVLQNIFFNSLNSNSKSTGKDFKWTSYLHPDFDYSWFTDIPYLNGGIFDKLDEDNARESIEDDVLKIPNYLFYGKKEIQTVEKGKGANKKKVKEDVEHKGLNGIFSEYKFTLEENTPFEVDIALDPELLGMVFENLLAELDPNLEENVKKSIRKLTGSYYTPRNVIQEMVNESIYLYLKKHLATHQDFGLLLKNLIYHGETESLTDTFKSEVVKALDQLKVLDPACGSGAFPMGVLHKMVEILQGVDPNNNLWVEQKLKNVDAGYRNEFRKILTQHLDDYSRKLGIIRDSIYGVDVQPMAVQITKLRFFISLLIDQDISKGITPMPNIETKIICANTLKNLQPDLFAMSAIDQLAEARLKYYQPDLTHEEREKVADEIIYVLDMAFPNFSKEITGNAVKGQNREFLKHWFTHATLAAPFFNLDFFYPELRGSGFDIVIGNPPYGGTKITDEVRQFLGIESKDPYGAFIARFLPSGDKPSPLKHGGVLAYIVSDTFMTIKSHLPLRRQMMDNYIHKMIRVHPDTFRATVNTAIIICERNQFPVDDKGHSMRQIREGHICQMADLTNISIHDRFERFMELLHETEGVDFEEVKPSVSSEEYAIYYYPQALIRTNSNLPFFVASPKLFALMNDMGEVAKGELELNGKKIKTRKIPLNGKEIEVVKLGEVAEVRQGLATGDNQAYLFQNPEARGTYKDINEYNEYLLTDDDMDKIRNDDKLRLAIIEKGISKTDKKSDRYFGGKYIVPYDKGGESDAQGGWMPNYFVPTNYFIDWSEWAVHRMKTFTIAERIREYGEAKAIKPNYETTTCAVIRSPETYFGKSISFSRTGVYSPTFRLGSQSAYDTEGSMIFQKVLDQHQSLGILTSKLTRFQLKNFIGNTVHSQVDELKELKLIVKSNKVIANCTKSIIENQRVENDYDYASHEQIEIDKLVYEAYGLNAEDVQEVEAWYARRYPKLSQAQKANLRKLGKSDDYLELYGMK